MSGSLYASLQSIAKPYKVLYVEDDEAISSVMGNILSLLCGTLYKAKNGIEGLELYHSCKPDLIITDISMPLMSGIDMVKEICSHDKQIPIMVNSAFSDQNYLLDSIYLGINRYTVKPIRHEEFLESLHYLFTQLKERDEALLYERIKLQERINHASTKMIQSMMEVYPHPTLVYTEDGRLYGLNHSATALFDIPHASHENKHEIIHTAFVEEEGYLSELDCVDEVSAKPYRVKIKTRKGSKIYTVVKKTIEAQEFGKLYIYAFSDITRLEYEKLKSQNLSMYFREMARFKNTSISQEQPQTALHVKSPLVEKNEPKRYENIRLEAMHYAKKTSALTYAQEMSEDVCEEMAEMDELEREMREALIIFEEENSLVALHEVAKGIARYAKTIGTLIDFEDVAFSLSKLCELLFGVRELSFNKRKMHLLLDGILEDLSQWRKMIFVTQEAKDIHYLDASLLSSCLQIETEFFGKTLAGEEELDLF